MCLNRVEAVGSAICYGIETSGAHSINFPMCHSFIGSALQLLAIWSYKKNRQRILQAAEKDSWEAR